MNKGASILAALLVLLVGLSAVAKDRKSTWFQQKIKLDPAAVTEHRGSPPAERAIPIAIPRTVPITPLSSTKGECYLIQDQGIASSYFDYFAAGDAVAMSRWTPPYAAILRTRCAIPTAASKGLLVPPGVSI